MANVRILFLDTCPPNMDVVTISHGIIAVMDLVEKMRQVEIVLKVLSWDKMTAAR